MSEALIGLFGALVGGLAAVGGAALQARSAEQRAREEADRREKEAKSREREAFRMITRRYLFQLPEAVDSLHYRVRNWAHEYGREVTEPSAPEYWGQSTLYAFARALGAERVLALEGVYVELKRTSHPLAQFQVQQAFEQVLKGRHVFFYHLLTLAESALDRGPDGFYLLTYTEFRQRYEDEQSGLQVYLKPVAKALSELSGNEVAPMLKPLSEVRKQLDQVTSQW